jgi:hypothetical protein
MTAPAVRLTSRVDELHLQIANIHKIAANQYKAGHHHKGDTELNGCLALLAELANLARANKAPTDGQ